MKRILFKRMVILLVTMSMVAFIPTLSVFAEDVSPTELAQEATEIAPMANIVTLHAATAFSTATSVNGLGMIQVGTTVTFLGTIQNNRAFVRPLSGTFAGIALWIPRTAIGR